MALASAASVTVQVPAVDPAVTAPALVTLQAPVAVKLIAKPELANPVQLPVAFTESRAGQLMLIVWLAGFTTKLLVAVAVL